jgi:hypothetical protein
MDSSRMNVTVMCGDPITSDRERDASHRRRHRALIYDSSTERSSLAD